MRHSFKTLTPIIALIAIITLSCSVNNQETNKTSESKFINFTDIHFNPFYDTTLVYSLNKYNVEKWDSIFSSTQTQNISQYDQETNYYLLETALDAMQKQLKKPDFLIMTGDFICHDFGEIYAKQTNNHNYQSMHKFLLKTISFVTSRVQARFPNTLIIPTFGNNDSYCGDYHLQNNGKFLEDFSNLYLPILHGSLSDTEANNLKQHGYYCVTNPNNTAHKIISFNSIYLSTKYDSDDYSWNCDCKTDKNIQDSIANLQFAWLEEQLVDSKAKNEKVWIITHIPAGVNVYKTIDDNKNLTSVTPFLYWKQNYNKLYLELLEKYSNQIFTTMTGHTHMDDFKLHNTNLAKAYIHISPSISPVFGNNPAFQIVDYNIQKAEFTNYTTYYIDIAKGNIASWQKEYNFNESYSINDLSADGYSKLLSNIDSDSTARKNYSRYFGVNSTKATQINNTNWNWYRCGISSTLSNNYVNCVEK